MMTSLSKVLSAVFGPGSVQIAQESARNIMGPARPQGESHVIGYSFEKRPIAGYRFGHGHRTVIFVGGIHGGYEWNTILLAYQAIDYFTDRPDAVPEDVTLIIIPTANPDGQYAITGKEGPFELSDLSPDSAAGRFNGRGVDLNRNWDCGWESTAWWRDRAVSGGKKPFSEPESRALRDFFLEKRPEGVIFWHSKAGAVYAAGCQELFKPARYLADVYGSASGYPVADQFAYYEVTGDASDWLSTQGIPSITVELASHDQIEWPKNLAGMIAVLDHFNESYREVFGFE
jgi:predicted deacylase